jgi:8-oxo-dGTP pyrophosphatase MutT (NUDIX family)
MGAKATYHLGTKLAIWRDDGCLLILWRNKDHSSHWDLPGGCPHPGEDPISALKREVIEEIGQVSFDEPRPIQLVMTPFKPFGNDTGLILWYHAARLMDSSKMMLGHEHSKAEWVRWEDACARLGNNGLQVPDLRLDRAA